MCQNNYSFQRGWPKLLELLSSGLLKSGLMFLDVPHQTITPNQITKRIVPNIAGFILSIINNNSKKIKERKGQKKEKEKRPFEKRKIHANIFSKLRIPFDGAQTEMPPPSKGRWRHFCSQLPFEKVMKFLLPNSIAKC